MQQKTKQARPVTWGRYSCGLYVFGAMLVLLSRLGLVPVRIGEIGWILGTVGGAIFIYLRWKPVPRR